MEHFTTEEWIDFMNQVVPHETRAAMQEHLFGCKRCARELDLWQKVHQTAAKENAWRPPDEILRVAKQAFRAAGHTTSQRTNSLVEVLFDSFLQPAIAGARSAAMGSRQMLYRAGNYQIDIQLELKPGTNLVAVAGQIMDVNLPDSVNRRIPVTLSNLQGHVIYTATNEFGEFRAEIQNSGVLELSVPSHGESAITISLRNALNELPGDPA
jgi:hypothetical protein